MKQHLVWTQPVVQFTAIETILSLQSGHAPLHQGLANIFCNEPESKYIKLCRPNYSILLLYCFAVVKAARDYGCGYIPVKTFFTKQAQIWLVGPQFTYPCSMITLFSYLSEVFVMLVCLKKNKKTRKKNTGFFLVKPSI